MKDCKNCRRDVSWGELFGCNNCGAEFCSSCATENKNICPYCYSDLELKG